MNSAEVIIANPASWVDSKQLYEITEALLTELNIIHLGQPEKNKIVQVFRTIYNAGQSRRQNSQD